MSSPALIHAEHVHKSFGKFEAVRGISLTIQRGQCFGLLGPNGAGKSTFINMLYGATQRTSGMLRVFDYDPTTQSRQIKRRMGVVTQENALDESLSVRENMELYAAFVERPRKERRRRVRDLLEFMNLAHKENEPIRTLSGGMRRRLVFVRALLGDPELVILDEPTTGLDPAVRHLLWGKVHQLKAEGKTVLLTTHYMHEAEVLCDRLVIMNQGEIIAEGTPAELRERHTPGYVAVFEKSAQAPRLRETAQSLGYQISEDSSGVYVRAPQLDALLQFQSQTDSNALQLRPSHLEDVFLKLTGQELGADA
ncbi:MAG: ABC transporter ATP-binding protein [Bdellovibrionales bacterium]